MAESKSPVADKPAAQQKTDKALEKERTPEGVHEDPNTGVPAPEGNAPGPEPVDNPVVTAVNTRPRIEPRDRATYLGPVNARTADTDIPDDFVLFGSDEDDDPVDLGGDSVDVFQVVATNGALALRVDGGTYVFDAEMARALARDVRAAQGNVVT
jgi:hypothetical protein